MNKLTKDTTIVIDAGGRYGMHPSWNDFQANLHYVSFEPDKEEAERLAVNSPGDWFQAIPLALDKSSGLRRLHITKHRGLCSFLAPDTNSEWFKSFRPGSGEIERKVEIETISVDAFAQERQLAVDFLKLDTEGTEQDVLEGAENSLRKSILGARVSVNFQRCYIGQPLISKTIDYLDSHGYFLLNLDYVGYGVPRNSFFRKPDPAVAESSRYGEMISNDGVWMLKYDNLIKRYSSDRDYLELATLKYAYFAHLNNAPDVCIDVLGRFLKESDRFWSDELKKTKLFKALRKICITFLGSWRVCEDSLWDEARDIAKKLFNVSLEGGSGYWEQVRSL